MGIPRSLKIRDVIKGEVADPMNVVFENPLEDVKTALKRDDRVEGVFLARSQAGGQGVV